MTQSLTDAPEDTRRRRLMVALWERMGQFFGAQWEKSYGTVEEQTIYAWQGALNQFTEDELAYAVKAIARDFKGAFPPTFPEFRDLCETARAYSKSRQLAQKAEDGTPLLEKLKRNAKTPTAQRELKRILAILAGDSDETKAQSWEKLGLSRTHGPLPKEPVGRLKRRARP